MPVKTLITATAMLLAVPALAHGGSRLGASAFADPYERGYDRFREDIRDGDRAVAAYYGFGTYISPFDREYRWPERVVRDRDGVLSYDRDYPYDFRYGGRGASGEGIVASSREVERRVVGDSLTIEGGVRVFRNGGAEAVRSDDVGR